VTSDSLQITPFGFQVSLWQVQGCFFEKSLLKCCSTLSLVASLVAFWIRIFQGKCEILRPEQRATRREHLDMGFASVVVEISPSFQAKDSRDGANMGQHIFNIF